MGTPAAGVRPRLLIVAVLAAIAMAALYVLGLFYLQLLLVVWGAVIIAGIVLFEGRSGPEARLAGQAGDEEQWGRLTQDLASVDDRISKADREDVRRLLLRQRSSIEQEIRRLGWSIKERGMETASLAPAPEGLKPMTRGVSWWRQRQLLRSEMAHFHQCLDLATESLRSESAEGSKEALKMVARDLKAHYDLLKSTRPHSRSLGEYGTAWAVLTAISRGADPRADLRHASKSCRRRLQSVADRAALKGLVADSEETYPAGS